MASPVFHRAVSVGESQHVFEVDSYTVSCIWPVASRLRQASSFMEDVRVIPVDEDTFHIGRTK